MTEEPRPDERRDEEGIADSIEDLEAPAGMQDDVAGGQCRQSQPALAGPPVA